MREGGIGLKKMAAGIFGCYHNAGVLPPKLLYTDPDCCGERNISSLFQDWTRLLIRLDVWYFIRCIATGCTTESHPLYGLFMAQLSHCIFEWSDEELTENVDIVKCLSKNQLSLHVRRRTRGVETTARMIDDLLSTFTGPHATHSRRPPPCCRPDLGYLEDREASPALHTRPCRCTALHTDQNVVKGGWGMGGASHFPVCQRIDIPRVLSSPSHNLHSR